MASINGITVKAIKKFRGHEGEPLCQGNVYLGNKRIGWWSQDAHGGADNLYLDEPYRARKFEEKIMELNRDKEETFSRDDGSTYTIDYSLDNLFGDLMELKADEDLFKSAIKNGYTGLLLITDGYHVFGWNLHKGLTDFSDEIILREYAELIEDGKKQHGFFKEDEFYKHKVKIYRSLDDFNIGEKIKIEDIK